MSKLDRMITELCPQGVEYKRIGEFAKCIAGATPSKARSEFWDNGTIPWMSSGEVNKGEIYSTDNKITQAGYDGSSTKLIPPNTVVMALAGQGKTRGMVAITRIELCTNQSLCAFVVGKEVIPEYLLHFFKSRYQDLRGKSNGDKDGARGGLNLKILNDYLVPVPPLDIQAEIIRVLDAFESKTNELVKDLETECSARKKQYEYYRNKMLSGGCDIQWKTLGDIGKVSMCKRIMKDETTNEGDIPFYKIGTFGGKANAFISRETFAEYSKKYSYPKKGDILISAAGTIGRTVIFDGEPAYFQDSNIVWLDNDETQVLNEFLYYWYQTNPWKITTGGTIARLYNDNIAGAKVPIMPIEMQKNLVRSLREYDAVYNKLNVDLPSEIEARQKQYSYYRDALLTFKKKA